MKAQRTSRSADQVHSVARLSFVLMLLILFVHVGGIDRVPNLRPDVAAQAPLRVFWTKAGNQGPKIGGLDQGRAGQGSFPLGDYFVDARAAITETYPATSFSSFPTLTPKETANIDILVLSSVAGVHLAIVPLASQEQSALTDYVELGGCAILLLDNDTFGPSAADANESLVNPFGMVTAGTYSGALIAKVPDASTSPVTTGPHGTISSFIQSGPGGLAILGPHAISLATNELGYAASVIKRDILATGSGPVVVYADNDSFKSAGAGGYFQGNRGLFLNTIALCLSKHKVYLPLVRKDAPCTVNETTSGRMEQDENWCGDVLITGSVEIAPGAKLTIQPGATIRFRAQTTDRLEGPEFFQNDPATTQTQSISMVVFGTLVAHGTVDEPIVFTSGFAVPGPRDWDSIAIEEGGTVDLDHVVLEHSYFGLQLNMPTSQASVRRSTFRHVTTTGIATGNHPINGPITVSDSQFLDCGREAIDTYSNQNIIVRHNVFSENYVAIMSVGSSITVESNRFISNTRGIGIVEHANPTIIGNEFTANDGAAIFVTNASPLITYNNIYTNVINLQLEDSERGVTAENNWWGSTDPTIIQASIWDGTDDPSLGIVELEPYATGPFDLDLP